MAPMPSCGVPAFRGLLPVDGIEPPPQASTTRSGLVLAMESSPSLLRLTPRRGLVGLDQLWDGGSAAPAAWCRVVPMHRRALGLLLLCRCHETQMTPAGVGSLFSIRWLSVATTPAIALADMPLTEDTALAVTTPA